MNVIIRESKITCEHLLGKFLDENHYDQIINEDTDLFFVNKSLGGNADESNCIFKFRKNVFTASEQSGAYEGLVGAAQPTQNRGLAAGPKEGKLNNRDWVTDYQFDIMDYFIKGSSNSVTGVSGLDEIELFHKNNKDSGARGMVWLREKISSAGYTYEDFFQKKLEEWKSTSLEEARKDAALVKKTYVSDTSYANQVNSGIAGFYDRYPRIPYGRATSYTAKYPEVFSKCFPFMQKLSCEFNELLPNRFSAQNNKANLLDERFRVAGTSTPFTTITVNKNFRTAAHRDAGDLSEGFSNLTVVANEKEWEGGYLVLPEYRVAIDVRPGDLLLINNHEGIHGNTEIKPPAGQKLEDMERISLVCYFREKMLELGSWEYESHRYNFVESRRKERNDPKFNGVTAGMWSSDEWYDYLRDNGGEDMLQQYHPQVEAGSLAGFL